MFSPIIIHQGRGGVVGPVGIIGPNGSAVRAVIKTEKKTFLPVMVQ